MREISFHIVTVFMTNSTKAISWNGVVEYQNEKKLVQWYKLLISISLNYLI